MGRELTSAWLAGATAGVGGRHQGMHQGQGMGGGESIGEERAVNDTGKYGVSSRTPAIPSHCIRHEASSLQDFSVCLSEDCSNVRLTSAATEVLE